MKNKILFGIIALILVVGGIMFLSKITGSGIPAETKPPETTEQSSTVAQPTEITQTETQTQEASVTITSSGFEPAIITIKAGTKVVWTNKSGGAATVNSNLHPTHLIYPQLNLNDVPNNESVSLVFYKAGGTYKYHDHLNPSRTGTVMVE